LEITIPALANSTNHKHQQQSNHYMNINSKKKLIFIEDVVKSVGLGYDLTNDLKLKPCKFGSRLFAFDYRDLQTIQLSDLVSIPIRCQKSSTRRFHYRDFGKEMRPIPRVLHLMESWCEREKSRWLW
ncbi:hypothetical protein RYX36_007651, partial [Vicia faba]